MCWRKTPMERSANGASGMRQRTVPTECSSGRCQQNVLAERATKTHRRKVPVGVEEEVAMDGNGVGANGVGKVGAADAEVAMKEDL